MSEGKRTEYVVLRRVGNANVTSGQVPASTRGWQEAGRAHATSAKEAIKQCVRETSGSYVAVPARSFQPVHVTVEQRATLKFDDPTAPQTPEQGGEA